MSCLILGLLGISEGVLPFIISDVGIIPICMIGSGVGGALGFAMGSNVFPGSSYGFFMWPIVDNIVGFLIALACGVLIVTVLMLLHAKRRFDKNLTVAK